MKSAVSDATPTSFIGVRGHLGEPLPPLLHPVPVRRLALCAAVVVIMTFMGLGALAPAASAQDTVVIGGSGLSSVVVDLSVLNADGGVSGRRQGLLMPGQEAPGQITLRPPRGAVSAGPLMKLRRPKAASRRLARAPSRAPARSQARSAPLVPLKKAPAAPRRMQKKMAPPPAPTMVRKAQPPAPPPAPPSAPAKVETAPLAVAKPAPAKAAMKPAMKPIVAATPPPAPAVVKSPPKTKVASLPPATRPATRPGKGGPHMRIEFAGASTRLTSAAKDRLAALADELGAGKSRLQLKAFAGGSAETASSARRLSLSRALAVRSFLIEEGLRSTRIDVRALGKAGGPGPAERVDIILLRR